MKVAIVVARFYEDLAERLIAGRARRPRGGGAPPTSTSSTCPAPSSCRWPRSYAAESGRYAGVVCLGAVIRGETSHYDYVCGEAARGIQDVQLRTGVPCSFGVLTVDTHGAGARPLRRRQARLGPPRGRGRARAAEDQAGPRARRPPGAAARSGLGTLRRVTLEVVAIVLTVVVHFLGAGSSWRRCSTARRSTGGRPAAARRRRRAGPRLRPAAGRRRPPGRGRRCPTPHRRPCACASPAASARATRARPPPGAPAPAHAGAGGALSVRRRRHRRAPRRAVSRRAWPAHGADDLA